MRFYRALATALAVAWASLCLGEQAQAQSCSGQFPSGTFCGNTGVSTAPPRPVPFISMNLNVTKVTVANEGVGGGYLGLDSMATPRQMLTIGNTANGDTTRLRIPNAGTAIQLEKNNATAIQTLFDDGRVLFGTGSPYAGALLTVAGPTILDLTNPVMSVSVPGFAFPTSISGPAAMSVTATWNGSASIVGTSIYGQSTVESDAPQSGAPAGVTGSTLVKRPSGSDSAGVIGILNNATTTDVAAYNGATTYAAGAFVWFGSNPVCDFVSLSSGNVGHSPPTVTSPTACIPAVANSFWRSVGQHGSVNGAGVWALGRGYGSGATGNTIDLFRATNEADDGASGAQHIRSGLLVNNTTAVNAPDYGVYVSSANLYGVRVGFDSSASNVLVPTYPFAFTLNTTSPTWYVDANGADHAAASASGGFFLGAKAALSLSGTFNVLWDTSGSNVAAQADSTDFYLQGNTNYFRTRGGVQQGSISTSGLTLGVATTLRGKLLLSGSTSGTLTLQGPATASGTLTLPAGTTDFSATGGTSQVVKQTSSGGALTVAQLAASDLSNGTTGSGGAVVLATGSTMTGGTHTGLTGLGIRSTGAAFDLTLASTEVFTAGRTLTITLNDAARTLNLGGNLTTAAAFTTSGANALTLTTTGSTNVTLPTTGTLVNSAVSTLSSLTTVSGGTLATAAFQTYSASTFTPTLIGSTSGSWTLSTAVGSYEQIGRQIVARFTIIASGSSSPVGDIQVGGLPFTSNATTNDNGACMLTYQSGFTNSTTYTQFTGSVTPSSTVVSVQEVGSGLATTNAAVARASSTPVLIGMCNYHT